ncbi:hypothetical protein HQ865_06495 [Mucilaginibacter mali]|uniref:Uncharacterized protein n=1 Tax=Mucilaginibacter mali TaxID=2740462 RepID=A0A7D4UCJ9_9SPHI|nr:hypothetical protein [Mucilaginibacter mali]QKJ29419.1 hypothetical protein HQ865_06495 [Mucilaginibacter mali]
MKITYIYIIKTLKTGMFDFLKGNKPDNENKACIIINHEPPEIDINTSPLNLTTLPTRDQLVLLLICKTNINTPRTLGHRLDMCDFPGNEGISIANLVNNQLIYFAKTNGLGHPIKYAVTDFGDQFLKKTLIHDKIIDYIKQMSNPDFMLKLVQAILEKMRSEQ